MAKYDSINPIALKKLVAAGTQLRAFPRPVMEACYKASNEQYAEWSEKVPEFKKLYDSYHKLHLDQIAWFKVAEDTYDSFINSIKT